ncbi:LpxI family protein [Rickettsiales endosymbiont of Peranema trichophorum]|nr:LpxI family protein [Rickettsiales endosymbiont of Peranema trichophorum]
MLGQFVCQKFSKIGSITDIMTTKIKKLGIIAGSDHLPRHIVDACVAKGIDFVLIGLAEQTTHELFTDIEYETFPLHAISRIIKKLKSEEVSHLIFVGKVKRTSISKLLLDLKGAKLFGRIIKSGMNDNGILSAVLGFFEAEGFKIVPVWEIASNIMVKCGSITNVGPTEEMWNDIERGLKVLKGIAQYDIGQALAIQSGLVLGVEAAEGTDELIKRCGEIQQKNEHGAILIKISKPEQDLRVDLPSIGLKTIRQLHHYKFSGIAVEAERSLILNQSEVVEEANKLGIFVHGISVCSSR